MEGRNPDALTGRRLGSCVLEALLGTGGMGAVYLARQERPHRRVAVKVLRPQLASDPDAWQLFLARFRREADATAALDHANIVPIFEFGEEDGIAYLVMPYLVDGSLNALLAREGPQPLARAVRFVEQAAAALDHAHQHGIVHRDVKPSNLLLHPDGRLLLADFGIARTMTQLEQLLPASAAGRHQPLLDDDVALTQMGVAMGTPEYMAPEQIHGGPVSAATDIYALGIVTYVILTGQSPFAGGDMHTVLASQLADPPRPLRTTRPDVPARVEEVLFAALAKEPVDRPATAGDYAEALHAASRGRTFGSVFGWTGATGRFAAHPPQNAAQLTAPVNQRQATNTQPLPLPQGAARPPEPLLSHRPTSPDAPTHAGTPQVGGPADVAPDDATVFDLHAPWRQPKPQWPSDTRAATHQRARTGGSRWWLAGLAAVMTTALLVAILLTGALARGGLLLPGSSGTAPGGLAHANATATATATPMPTATPTPPPNWLLISPSYISLGCRGPKKSVNVELRNIGPSPVRWEATSSTVFGIAQVTLSPQAGTLDANKHVTIQITNNMVLLSRSGMVTFNPANEQAGQPAVVQFTPSC